MIELITQEQPSLNPITKTYIKEFYFKQGVSHNWYFDKQEELRN